MYSGYRMLAGNRMHFGSRVFSQGAVQGHHSLNGGVVIGNGQSLESVCISKKQSVDRE